MLLTGGLLLAGQGQGHGQFEVDPRQVSRLGSPGKTAALLGRRLQDGRRARRIPLAKQEHVAQAAQQVRLQPLPLRFFLVGDFIRVQ